MTFKEVRKLLKMMNVDMNEEHALHLFTVSPYCFLMGKTRTASVNYVLKVKSPLFPQMADKSDSGSLEIEQFVLFYKMLTQRDEVWKVFQDYSGDGEKLMLEELENFLKTEQQEGEQSVQHAPELIDRYEPSDSGEHGCDLPQSHRQLPGYIQALKYSKYMFLSCLNCCDIKY